MSEQQNKEKDWKGINAKLDDETFEKFVELQAYYRAPTFTHTLRLMIEDTHREMLSKAVKKGVSV